MSSKAVALLLFPLAFASACDDGPTQSGIVCPAILIPSVAAEIRDATGKGAAAGTTLRLIGEPDLFNTPVPAVGVDSLMMFAGGNDVDGPMDIEFSKPGFSTVTVRNVKLPTGACGVTSRAEIAVTLKVPPAASVAVLK